jgi:type III polyketide synthase
MTRLPQKDASAPKLWILGLGTQYPDHRLTAQDLESIAARHYDVQSEGYDPPISQWINEWLTCVHSLRKLLAINKKTGIQTRAAVSDYKQDSTTKPGPPTIVDLDEQFRDIGVDLATRACEKALHEAGLVPEDITHTVAVTCTNQGSPGYNLLVHEKLGLRSDVDHTLLHGVGCAGGLSIMRAAAQMALASTARGRPARVLAFACELCTPNVRSELAAAEKSSAEDVCVAATLFSDGAAAFILTNGIGKGRRKAKFQLLAFDNAVLPSTMSHMSYFVHETGK